MRSEQDIGRPPPRISSRDGIPVDVSKVDGDDGDGLVPTGSSALAPAFRLKEDMMVTN